MQSLTIGCVGEFTHVVRAFTPIAPTSTSCETINVLQALHPFMFRFPLPIFIDDFQPNVDFEFFLNSFMSTFMCLSHLSINGL
jgi:hypothetical protein